MAKMKTFTLEDAQNLLPALSSLLKQCMENKKLVDQIEKEFQDLGHRILLSGGLSIDILGAARRRAECDKAMQVVKDAIAEIGAIGVQVKDLDIGLLDFPCQIEGDVVLLCWKHGEEKIEFWHGMDEGFAGRKPIDQRITRPRKKERPN